MSEKCKLEPLSDEEIIDSLRSANEQLKAELADSNERAEKWERLHVELNRYAYDKEDEVKSLKAELAVTQEREQQLRKALEWYADLANWTAPVDLARLRDSILGGEIAAEGDCGKRARAALAAQPTGRMAKLEAVAQDIAGRVCAFDLWGIEDRLPKRDRAAWKELAEIANKVLDGTALAALDEQAK